MPASHDPKLKEEARRLMEEEGFTLTETARKVGVSKTVISDWATAGEWRRTEVIRQVRIQEQKLVTDPVLDAAIQRLDKMPRSQREAEYDEAMHRWATAVPILLKQIPHNELVTKADKVAKLIEVSRKVLGKDESKARPAMLSVGILSSAPIPSRISQPLELADAEVDTLTGDAVRVAG